ncbi:MAG: carboxypeptidase regulatory-like domain-containing protein [Deltaproteobacteria bacterium]|nr:carboxypeptidase regulatory-like domain-containing protein [Deltaproteobacteria bacterium]
MARKSMRLVVGIVWALASACADLQQDPLDQGTGTIQGAVKNDEGQAVEAALVYILSDVSLFAESDESGAFVLESVPAGTHTLVAVSESGLGTSIEVTVFGHKTCEVDLTLTEAGRLIGSVTLEGEQDHQGSLVYLPGTSFIGYTNAAGAFILFGVAPGCYGLHAEHPGFLSRDLEPVCIQAGQDRTLQEITLLRSAAECAADEDCGLHQGCRQGRCVYEEGYSDETCNGEDDDGDGLVDEGLARACGIDEGACEPGVSQCLGGVMSACMWEVGPETEICDDELDNDCDGQTDEPDCTYVKVQFIVDCSGSMQMTDEDNLRVQGVREVVEHFAASPGVVFSVVKFNMRVQVLTDGFTRLNGDELEVFGPEGLMEADSMTDYAGALIAAREEIARDIQAADPATAARTKYMVVFLSDGKPEPVCDTCASEPPEHPDYDPHCDADLGVVCYLNDDIALDLGLLQPGELPGLQPHNAYNTDARVLELVDAIAALDDESVGEIQLHTGYLYCRDEHGNPTTPTCSAAEQAYGLDPEASRALLRAMAEHGHGSFTFYTSGSPIDFLQLDYSVD